MENEIKKYKRLYIAKKVLQILAVLGVVVSVFGFILYNKDTVKQLTAEEIAHAEMVKQIDAKLDAIFATEIIDKHAKAEGLNLSVFSKSIMFHMMDMKDGIAHSKMLKEEYYKNPEKFNKKNYAPFKPKMYMVCASKITFDRTGKFVNFEFMHNDEETFCNYYKKAVIKLAKNAKIEMPEALTGNYFYGNSIQIIRPYEMAVNK